MILMATVAAAQSPVIDHRVLLVLWHGETEGVTAFKDSLLHRAPGTHFQTIDAMMNRNRLAEALRGEAENLKNGTYAAVYTHGTQPTQIAAFLAHQTPIIFQSVFDPKAAGVDGQANVTGVTNRVSIDRQFAILTRLRPIHRLIVLFSVREPNAVAGEAEVAAWASANGIDVATRRVTPDTLGAILEELRDGRLSGDALYAGSDYFVAANARAIASAAGNRLALFGGTEIYVQRGWLAAYAPPIADLGRMAGVLVEQVLNGTPPKALGTVQVPPHLFVSTAAAAALGLTPPSDAFRLP